MGKPVFRISDQFLHKHSYTATEDGTCKNFELSLGFKYCQCIKRKQNHCTFYYDDLCLYIKVIEKQRTGTGAIKRQIPLLKPKRDINPIIGRLKEFKFIFRL